MIQVSENSKCKTDDDNYSSLARVYHVAHDDARSDKPRCSCSTRHGNIAYESTILHGGANKRPNRKQRCDETSRRPCRHSMRYAATSQPNLRIMSVKVGIEEQQVRRTHSFATGPVMAEPFISPLGLTMTPALSSK